MDETVLKKFIKNHYKAAQEMTIAAAIQISLAIIAILVLPKVVKIGGTIFGALSLIPTKEILERREKARNLEALQILIQSLPEKQALSSEEEQDIKELLLKSI